MKRAYSLIVVAAMAAMASCSTDNIGESGVTLQPELKEISIAVASDGTTSRVASSDSANGGLSFVWENTDKIGALSNGATPTYTALDIDATKINGAAAKFVGKTAADATEVRLVYPFDESAFEAATSLYAINVAAQAAAFDTPLKGNLNYMASAAATPIDEFGNNTEAVTLSPLTAGVKFLFSFENIDELKELTLKSLTVTGFNTSSAVDLTKEVSDASFYNGTAASDLVLSFVQSPKIKNGVEYRVDAAVIPTEMLTGTDVKLTATFSDNSTLEFTKSVAASYNFKAGLLHPFGKDGDVVFEAVVIDETWDATLQSVKMTEDEKLSLTFDAKIKEDGISNTCGISVKRNDAAVNVTNVALDVNPYKLIVEVDGGIWNGDDVLVSYAAGTLATQGGKVVLAVADNVVDGAAVPYTPYNNNIFVNGDFEEASPLPQPYTQWNIYDGDSFISIVDAAASGDVASGSKCMKFGPVSSEIKEPNLRSGTACDIIFDPAKEYVFAMDYQRTTEGWLCSIAFTPIDMIEGWWQIIIPEHSGETYVGPDTINKWMHNEQKFMGSEAIENEKFWDMTHQAYYSIGGVADDTTIFYFDNIQLYEYKRHE